MKGDLGGVEVAQGVDPVSGHIPTEKWQPQTVHKPQQKSQQCHGTHQPQPTAKQCGVTAGGRED
ncbi:hypothetical protein DPMN_159563 [Dreissena polymorpha]|uniref:Uncharacterized protein n=1 Tax=Dreissena polymorpha TaxID=45954 RepID=A0A9D4EJX0_DREPO|nr:hypothetical protein DPMN_159563 [Dreissena polymorpha]